MAIYLSSSKEIGRRMVAFTDLLVALYIGLLLGSIIFFWSSISLNLPFFFYGNFLYVVMAFLALTAMSRFFISYSKTRVTLTQEYLERTIMNTKERIYYKDVEKIKVLWTTRRLVRDIVVTESKGKTYVFDGMDKFEDLKNQLEDRCEVIVEESHEFGDFDHGLFYPLLGLVLGTSSIYFFKLFISMNLAQIRMMHKVFSLYLFILGFYFLIGKPFVKRYGNKLKKNDYIYAAISIIASLIIFNLL